MEIRVAGKGGHGARADIGIDPITTVGHIITRIQTFVRREVKPGELGVISFGSIHGGASASVIPDHVDLKLTFRAYSSIFQHIPARPNNAS